MIRGFYNGVSGIKTQSFGMDVWSNNISNINNVGFRSSTPEYKSIFYQSMVSAGNKPTSDQVGLGATSQTTALNMNNGSFQSTDNSFDFAINGDGFFGVKDRLGGLYFTRAGNFDVDGAGNLVDMRGNFVQGTMNLLNQITPSASAMMKYGKGANTPAYSVVNGNSPIKMASESAQSNVRLPNFLYQPPQPTTKVNVSGNLNSTKNVERVSITLDKANYTTTINATSKTISLSGNVLKDKSILNYKKGDVVTVRIQDKDGKFVEATALPDDDGNWSINDYALNYMDMDSIETKATLATSQEVANTQKLSAQIIGTNGESQLLSITFTKQLPQGADFTKWSAHASITDKNGNVVATQSGELVFDSKSHLVSTTLASIGGVSMNFGGNGDLGVYNGLRSSGATGATDIRADGYHEGILKNYGMDSDSNIIAQMSNGNSLYVAKLGIYHFQNDQGLAKIGDNTFTKTANSGEPFFYKNKVGEYIYGAKLRSNMLEMSNVDLGTALTEVIVTQKAYDASSKSITTSDEMIQTAINMKR